MTAAHQEPAETARAALSILTTDRELPDLLDEWTVESVVPHDIELRCATEKDPLSVVKTLMHVCDFSQIPVLSEDRHTLKGSVTWKSLGRFSSEGKTTAGEVMAAGGNGAKATDPLLNHIQTIIANDYIYVQDGRGSYNAIVTTTDLANSFVEISGPFMKLRDIERRLRNLLRNTFSNDEIRAGLRTVEDLQKIRSVDDLAFGHYVEIIQRRNYWEKTGLPFDRVTIVNHLQEVNKVRNRVMHFRPEPLTIQQSLVLDWCLNWLTECQVITEA